MKTIEQLKDIEMELDGRVTKTHTAARAFDDGDHWQSGDGFLPFAYMDAADKSRLQTKVEASFVSENIISKVITNEQNGFLGREPDWAAVPETIGGELTDEQEKLKEEIESALIEYWNTEAGLELLQMANRISSTNEKVVIRAFVPPGLVVDGALPPRTDLFDAMRLLKFEVLTADKAGVFYDAETYEPFGLFVSEKEGIKKYELTFVDKDGKTRVKLLSQSQYDALAQDTLPSLRTYLPDEISDEMESFAPVELGGELFYFEIDRKALITAAIMSNQKAVNLNHSMQMRNTFQHGSRAIVAMNVQPPVEETGLKNADGSPELRKVPINVDGSAVNLLNGVPVFDMSDANKGKIIGFANPDFQVIEPSDPEVFIKGVESEAAAIYRQTCQEHLVISEKAIISGKSKEESRVAFEKNLKDLKATFDEAGRWLLKVLSLFAADITNRSAQFSDFRFDFNCIVDAGTPSAEIRTQAATDVKDGRLSLETYLSSYCAIEDADAERERLEASEMHQLALAKSRLETAKLARDLGLLPKFVIDFLKIEDKALKKELTTALEAKQEEQKQERQAAMNGNNGFAQ